MLDEGNCQVHSSGKPSQKAGFDRDNAAYGFNYTRTLIRSSTPRESAKHFPLVGVVASLNVKFEVSLDRWDMRN
jgi:hypothetical protein